MVFIFDNMEYGVFFSESFSNDFFLSIYFVEQKESIRTMQAAL